jgi:putative transposase
VYDYRKMTPEQRVEAVEYRRLHEHPLHSPPHMKFHGQRQFFITGTCYEHQHHIGLTTERMSHFEADLLTACEKFAVSTYAWCILPNHYHVLLRSDDIEAMRQELGRLHGGSSFNWNGEENTRGRQVWFNCFDRVIKSHRHFWASANYIHHNPVHMVTSIVGRIGCGRVRRSFWSAWAANERCRSGASFRSWITERSGTLTEERACEYRRIEYIYET